MCHRDQTISPTLALCFLPHLFTWDDSFGLERFWSTLDCILEIQPQYLKMFSSLLMLVNIQSSFVSICGVGF